MLKFLLPYGDIRYSGMVAKNGAHSGGGGKRLRSRVVEGKTVLGVRRRSV